jgi:hypothetical protein
LTEIVGKAIPKIPSNFAAMNDAPDKVVASIKSNPSTANPSTETLSFEVIPLIAPDPY